MADPPAGGPLEGEISGGLQGAPDDTPASQQEREALERRLSVEIQGADGHPTQGGLRQLEAALSVYPRTVLEGVIVRFDGRDPVASRDPGHWEPGTSIVVINDEKDAQVAAHEIAHYLVEMRFATWGEKLKALLRANRVEVTGSRYQLASIRGTAKEWSEKAAEAVSLFARGIYRPEQPELADHLQQVIQRVPASAD